MTAVTENHETEQNQPTELVEDVAPTPKRSSNTSSAGGNPWERMGNGHDVHPAFFHPWCAAAYTTVAGITIDYADLSNTTLGIGTTISGLVGTGIGAGFVDTQGDEAQEAYMHEAGALGGATGLATSAWAWAAQANDLVHNFVHAPGMWTSLALGSLAWAGWYVSLRLRLNRVRSPKSEKQTKRLRKALGGVYEEIMRKSGYGECTVVEIVKGFNGASERVYIDLDDERHDTNTQVVNYQDKIAGAARSVFKTKRAIRLPNDAVTVSAATNDAARVILDVRFRDVLHESIDPSEGGDFLVPVTDPREPLRIGLWQHGDPIDVPESGPHGIGVGSTGSGKSTYSRALVINWMLRPHVAIGLIGLSKFFNMAKQFTQPAADGLAKRPVFALMAGGDGQSDEEIDSAVQGLMTLYTLMNQRMQNPDLPRDGDGNMIPSRKHPRFITYMDEIDVLIKRTSETRNSSKYYRLPNGQSVSVPEMLNEISSKGRSEGVELELSSQRITDSHMGGPWAFRDFLTNTHRRVIFWTPAQPDAQALSNKVDASKIQKSTMRMALASDQKPTPGKVFHYQHHHVLEAIQAMEENETFGTLSGDEAASLGSLWSKRWQRAKPIQRYFKSLGAEIDAEIDAGGPVATAETASSIPEGRSERSGTTQIGQKNSKLQAAIEKAHREDEQNENSGDAEDELTESQRAFLDSAMEDIAAITMPPKDMPAAKVLRQVVDIMNNNNVDDATPYELLVELGWIPEDPDTNEYNELSGVLKSKLREATGNDQLGTKQSRRRENRQRAWFLADLTGGEQQ